MDVSSIQQLLPQFVCKHVMVALMLAGDPPPHSVSISTLLLSLLARPRLLSMLLSFSVLEHSHVNAPCSVLNLQLAILSVTMFEPLLCARW